MSHSVPTLASTKWAGCGSDQRAVARLPFTSMSIDPSAALLNASGSSRDRRCFSACSQRSPLAWRVSWRQALAVSPSASALRYEVAVLLIFSWFEGFPTPHPAARAAARSTRTRTPRMPIGFCALMPVLSLTPTSCRKAGGETKVDPDARLGQCSGMTPEAALQVRVAEGDYGVNDPPNVVG